MHNANAIALPKNDEEHIEKLKAVIQVLPQGKVLDHVIHSDLITAPGLLYLRPHVRFDGGENVIAVGYGRSVAVFQYCKDGQRSPLGINVWNGELEVNDLPRQTPEREFEFPYQMPDDPASTLLAVVIANRGPAIVDQAVFEYVYPCTATFKGAGTIGELMDRQRREEPTGIPSAGSHSA